MTSLSGTNLKNRGVFSPKGEGRGNPSNFPAYPEYKNSGFKWLGIVPSTWKVGRLKHLLQIRGGQDYKSVESGEPTGFPVIGSGGQFTYATDYLYDGESVLLGRKGTIDKPLYVKGKFWTVDTMFYTEVLPSTNGRYAYYAAKTIPFSLYSTNTALPSMSQFDLANHALPLPSFQEQTQIARFLDHETARIDALIEEQQRLIELLKEKRQAVISHAVTKGLDPNVPMKDSGVEWLGKVPEHWGVATLKRIAKRIVVGIAEAATHAYCDDGIPILRATNIKNEKITGELLFVNHEFAEALESKKIHSGDLVTVRTGNAGVTARIPNSLDGCQCFTMLVTTLDEKSTPDFYSKFLNCNFSQAYFSVEGWGTAQVNISVPILEDLPVAVPPSPEQERICRYLAEETGRLDNLADQAVAMKKLLNERRSALISAAVTGKIDVRNWQPDQSSTAGTGEDYAMVAEQSAEYR